MRATVGSFAVLIVFILIRPTGILGKADVNKV